MEESDLGQMVVPKFPSEITGLKFENDLKFKSEPISEEKESRERTSRSQSVRFNSFGSQIEAIVSNEVQAENAQRILNQLDEIPSESKYSAVETEANLNDTNKESEKYVDDVELEDP